MPDEKDKKDRDKPKAELPTPRFYVVKEGDGCTELVFRVDGSRSETAGRQLRPESSRPRRRRFPRWPS